MLPSIQFNCRDRKRRGSAVMDAALVLPLLLALMFGTVEYGYYFFVRHTLTAAAREGARAGIMPSGNNTKVTNAIVQYLYNAGLQSSSTSLDSKFTLSINPAADTVTTGNPMTVTISVSWGNIGSAYRPLGIIPTTKNVTGTTVMRKE
jgi:Flp pilus assembly protein TadG